MTELLWPNGGLNQGDTENTENSSTCSAFSVSPWFKHICK